MSARFAPLGVMATGALATALVGLAAAPGFAATTGSATATALVAHVGGQAVTTGSFEAVNAGDGQQTTGTNQPAVPALLDQQGVLSVGTLFQDATARDDGSSAACAGIAGDSATLIQVGESTSCFSGADNLRLSLAELDLDGLTAQLPAALRDQLETLGLAGPVQEQLDAALAGLPDGGLYLDLTGIEGQCTAMPPQGDALFADVALRGVIGDEEITVLDFENRYVPNTVLPTDLAAFYDQLLADVQATLESGLGGQTGPLADLPAALRDQALESALDQIATELQPVEDQLVRLTLNKQEKDADSITVTALDLDLLPAANSQLGGQALSLELGQVTCTATPRAVPTTAPTTAPTPAPTPDAELPAYPTAVPAGQVPPTQDEGLPYGALALVGLTALATGRVFLAGRRD